LYIKQFDTKDLHLLKGLNTEKYLLIKSEEYCLTMGDYLTIQVKCCHLFRNSGLFVLIHMHIAVSQGQKMVQKHSNRKGPTACQVIFMKTWLIWIQERFSGRFFRTPCEQISSLLCLLRMMGYDMPGDWLCYFDRYLKRGGGRALDPQRRSSL